MAIFVIYSDLKHDQSKWKETLNHILAYKHDIYIVGDDTTINYNRTFML